MTLPGDIREFIRLSKLRVMIPVSITGFTGYFIRDPDLSLYSVLVTAGILMLGISASVVNQIQEADIDAIMARTRNRPIPSGRISKVQAGVYALIMLISGTLLIFLAGNLSASLFGLINIIIYNLIYTPLKRKTAFAVVPGALTGALPPVIGWVAAGGSVQDQNILFISFLLFMGQIPHFWLLIARYGEDYRLAGLPTLTGFFSTIQIRRLIFTWVLTTVAAAIFLSVFDIIRMQVVTLALLTISFFLVWKFSGLLKSSDTQKNISGYSVLLNSYFLMIMVLLIADRMISP